jgi:hypothetical protein
MGVRDSSNAAQMIMESRGCPALIYYPAQASANIDAATNWLSRAGKPGSGILGMPPRSMYAVYTFFSLPHPTGCGADKTIFGVDADSLRKIAVRINCELMRCKGGVPGRLADPTGGIPLAGDGNATEMRVA